MADIQVVRSVEVEATQLPGAADKDSGWIKRIIYPPNVNPKGILMGIAEVNPGYSPHRWHTHTRDETKDHETIYAETFEEIYYIITGSGVVQWKSQDGSMMEKKVAAGDTVFFPIGAPEHQLLNNGTQKMVILFSGAPPVKFIPKTHR